MNIQEAKDLATLEYGVVFPISREDFIKIKSKIIFKLHPDKNDGECDKTKFDDALEMLRIIKENFDTINGFVNSGDILGTRTRTGELLTDLGKGLGDLQNGCNCDYCKGKGYNIVDVPIYGSNSECPHCDHGFIKSAPCNACKGTGRFKTKSDFDVKCKACDGTKIHAYTKPRVCPVCTGFWFWFFQRVKVIGIKKEYHKCYNCDGKGQMPIHNQVFQKGAMNVHSSIDKNNKSDYDYKRQKKVLNKMMAKIKPQSKPIYLLF